MELEHSNLGILDFMGPLFENPLVHVTGGPGVGKSLLLLYYLGHRTLARNEGVLWIDAGASFPPNRAKVLFGRDAPAVLSHMMVARASSLSHLKEISSELVLRGSPPGTTRVVVDPISRLPRYALTQTTHSFGQGRFVADDFFARVIEPLLVAGTRDGFQIILVHEDSQDHPFWWGRYPSREHRVHLKKDIFKPLLRGIYDSHWNRVAILDLSHNAINIRQVYLTKTSEEEEKEDQIS